MKSKMNNLIRAVEDRGFIVRRQDQYLYRINGKVFVIDEALRVMRNIIKQYRIREDLRPAFNQAHNFSMSDL